MEGKQGIIAARQTAHYHLARQMLLSKRPVYTYRHQENMLMLMRMHLCLP